MHAEKSASSEQDISTVEWQRWCRLCAKEDVNGNVNVFCKDEHDRNSVDSTLATAIGKYFWVNIKSNDSMSKYICMECNALVTSLIELAERVNKVQAMFCVLENSKEANAYEVRNQYGLHPDEWQHIIKLTQTNESEGVDEDEYVIKEEQADEQFKELDELDAIISGQDELSFMYTTDEDLFKQLKYKDDKNGENEQCKPKSPPNKERALENTRKRTCNKILKPETDSNDILHPLRRKRGRPSRDSKLSGIPEPEFRYQCKICERKYKNATSYRKHMTDTHNTEPDIPNFTCDKCPKKEFATEKQLAVHMRSHLPLNEKLNIPCPYCDKKFTQIPVMRQHVSGIHYNEKPFVCDECGRAVKTLAALNEHKVVHTEDCPYECDLCHKRFKNKARLKRHSDIHTTTMYACPECGVQLNTRRTLRLHMLVHSDEKQFRCNICDSAFKRSKALKNHLILHTGMRPYKCNFCDKTFSNGSNCRSHKKKMHPHELAEEEATGKKNKPTTVPKLDELRSKYNNAQECELSESS